MYHIQSKHNLLYNITYYYSLIIFRPKTEFPLTRPTAGPFKVEITKGLFSLGLTLTVDSYTGVIVVKNISSRSPLAKDGNLK